MCFFFFAHFFVDPRRCQNVLYLSVDFCWWFTCIFVRKIFVRLFLEVKETTCRFEIFLLIRCNFRPKVVVRWLSQFYWMFFISSGNLQNTGWWYKCLPLKQQTWRWQRVRLSQRTWCWRHLPKCTPQDCFENLVSETQTFRKLRKILGNLSILRKNELWKRFHNFW